MPNAFTTLYERAQQGDRVAWEAIYSIAFQRLKRIASALLRRERPGHTLQPTAVVSELFLKLRRLEMRILNEDHFFRISARAMRQVLIDHSRCKPVVTCVPVDIAADLSLALTSDHDPSASESLMAARMAFDRLRSLDKRVAETVWLRAVEGLTIAETSKIQRREPWRVRADYDFGLQWLANRLARQV
jgi:RNA polymerase sigma factor (TIGR02999 family)